MCFAARRPSDIYVRLPLASSAPAQGVRVHAEGEGPDALPPRVAARGRHVERGVLWRHHEAAGVREHARAERLRLRGQLQAHARVVALRPHDLVVHLRVARQISLNREYFYTKQ